MLQGCSELECLSDWLFSNNHNLKKLWIFNCPKMSHLVPRLGGGGATSLLRELWIYNCSSLRELPDDLHSLHCLETLKIAGCQDLKSIPYPISSGGGQHQQQQQQQQQQGFTSLRELFFTYCYELTYLPIEMIESCAASLQYLILNELRNVTNLGMVIGCLHRMPRLEKLTIGEVPRFSSKDIIGSLRLQELEMGPFSDSSWNNVSFNETVGAIMSAQSIGSLRKLTLLGKEHWDSLPDQLQHLTSLEDLTLYYFGIEALPEWFGKLLSLNRLKLTNCRKLRHLPSKQAMLRLSKLIHLEILRYQPNRRNNINNPQFDDSEWTKISHIPTVKLDGRRISFI